MIRVINKLNKFLRLTTVDSSTKLTIDKVSFPTTLDQSVSIVPSKLRLVTLVSLLHQKCHEEKLKIVVFFSCRDSVHFHHKLFDKVCFMLFCWFMCIDLKIYFLSYNVCLSIVLVAMFGIIGRGAEKLWVLKNSPSLSNINSLNRFQNVCSHTIKIVLINTSFQLSSRSFL